MTFTVRHITSSSGDHMEEPIIANLPVGAELLERLEARRLKWRHGDFHQTLALLLDVVDFSESKAAEELTGMLEPDTQPAGDPQP